MSVSVKENALRPKETAPGWGDLTDDPFEALRRLSIFRALTEKEINRIADVAEVVRIEQDSVVPRGGEGADAAAYYFVLRGQIAFAEFEQGKVPPKAKNKKKRTTPTI